MQDKVTVEVNGVVKEYDKGINLFEISNDFKSNFKHEILLANINGRVVELGEVVKNDLKLEFYDLSSSVGNKTYERGLLFLFIYAVKEILGDDTKVRVAHSLDKGLYITINKTLDEKKVKALKEEMLEIVNKDLFFKKVNVSRKEAIKFFSSIGAVDKMNLLKVVNSTYITLYKINEMYDYFFGDMPYSTGALKTFDLTYLNENGIVLRYPTMYQSDSIPKYNHHEKFFNKYLEFKDWAKMLELENCSDLNTYIASGRIGDLIQMTEAVQNDKLYSIAKEIFKKKDKIKVVLIAGPSSSGKTTTSIKLELYLASLGLIPKSISLDNYYLEREEQKPDEDGYVDLESINALDLELFNKQLASLLKGEEVVIPEYNFLTGEKEYNSEPIKLQKNEILIFEGLHGLNEELTASVSRENKYKIYISPLTELNLDNHNRIHTTDNRLLRRIVRDSKFRGYTASMTLTAWKDVRMGEEKYVFPYQDEADVIFNTALIYELSVLKTYVEPLLYSVEETDTNKAEAIRLMNFLRNFLPISGEEVPSDSILREFIGGSCFYE